MERDCERVHNPKATQLNDQLRRQIAVIGAGNGGQAIAGHLASMGCDVRLHDCNPAQIDPLISSSVIELTGVRSARARLAVVSSDLSQVVRGAEVVMVVTTADAHRAVAMSLAPLLEDGQVVLLHPGRTGGALEFRAVLKEVGFRRCILVAETQTLVFACRLEAPGRVRIIGEKSFVPVAALPRTDTQATLECLNGLFPCMEPAEHVLRTSFENIGAIFHTAVVIFNAATIERGVPFYFYQDMTPTVADFLLQLDNERLELGRVYGMNLLPITDWIRKAYPGSCGQTLCELMRSNPAYHDISAPQTLASRYLLEDIPTGLVAYCAFAEAAGLRLPLMTSLIRLGSALAARDFNGSGRTLPRLGLAGLHYTEILKAV
jgi:opine dehydrogenase